LFYKGSACKSSANLDDIAVSKTPVYFYGSLRTRVSPHGKQLLVMIVTMQPTPGMCLEWGERITIITNILNTPPVDMHQ
jgi:hypothetical protein